MSAATKRLMALLEAEGVPTPVTEYRFHTERRWAFDLAWPDLRLAVEMDGGGWIRGGHSRELGMQKDAEKRNAAQCLGWIVLVVTPTMIDRPANGVSTALEWVITGISQRRLEAEGETWTRASH